MPNVLHRRTTGQKSDISGIPYMAKQAVTSTTNSILREECLHGH